MNKYNITQKNLVYKAELAHAGGLRHSGLSGTVCEDLLAKDLRKNFSNLNFDRGIIKFGNPDVVGANLRSSDLSSQFDVIIYKGKPLYKEAGSVVVHFKDVVGIIEVKKWMTLKMFAELCNDFTIISDNFRAKAKKGLKIFLVAFRCHDGGGNRDRRMKKRDGFRWWTKNSKIFDKICFPICFSGSYTRKNKVNLYPQEEDWFVDFENYEYAGQYEKLIGFIKKI